VHVDPVCPSGRKAQGCTLPATARLRRPREFATVVASSRAASLRLGSGWLSVIAAGFPVAPAGARLGITVSKRMARRAVDRALVKRIVRESFRRWRQALDDVSLRAGLRIDVSVRLRRPVALPGTPARPALQAWRAALRAEADELFVAVAAHYREAS
jgi:ribonuclease P protein component